MLGFSTPYFSILVILVFSFIFLDLEGWSTPYLISIVFFDIDLILSDNNGHVTPYFSIDVFFLFKITSELELAQLDEQKVLYLFLYQDTWLEHLVFLQFGTEKRLFFS